ncbi:hypothetical protein BDP27DRAFT_1241705 [Rhodocollybia butyracea]|uniref:Uncharacterized protein n=1 Tax=Rhodocollybia butyracea TaxID=206335 RepID=A0A9P5TX00_9AGAR|nr:hypothetical protein BDP27DRAFT_1241705 [Rhodocollybia butyracea]
MTRGQQRKKLYNAWQKKKVHTRSVQVHTASAGEGLDIARDSCISKPGWMGVNASRDARGEIQDALAKTPGLAHTIFSGIKLIPYVPHLATAICDRAKQMFLYRSQLTSNMLDNLLPRVDEAVPRFIEAIRHPFSEDDMLRNLCGTHWFSIAGHDRNNKRVHQHLWIFFALDPPCIRYHRRPSSNRQITRPFPTFLRQVKF